MLYLTLKEIEQAIKGSDEVSFNLNDGFNCPVALAGKKKFDESFFMVEHDLGLYFVDCNSYRQNSVNIPTSWAHYTKNSSHFVTKAELLKAIPTMDGYNDDVFETIDVLDKEGFTVLKYGVDYEFELLYLLIAEKEENTFSFVLIEKNESYEKGFILARNSFQSSKQEAINKFIKTLEEINANSI